MYKKSHLLFSSLFLFLVFALISPYVYALSFVIPQNSNMVGLAKTTITHKDEDFSAIAQRYDVGYYELFEANPGVDPDNPPPNTALIIPTQYILPQELRENTIIINLAEMRLYFQPKNSQQIYIFPIGIGKEGWNTPIGIMKIAQKSVNPEWVVPDSIYKFRQMIGDPVKHVVPPGPENPLGKYKLRLSNPLIAIHGTNDPEGIGRRVTAGCIRLYPNDIEQLYHMVDIGTTVIIINYPYKAGWRNGKLYLEAHMPLSEQRLRWGNDVSPAMKVIEAQDPSHTARIDWQKATQIAQEHLCVPREVGRV